MKRIIIIAGIIVSGLFSSCQDSVDSYLESVSKSTMDESVIFSTPDLAKSAVDGIKIPFGETNSYRGRYLPYYGLNTDTEWLAASQTPGDKSDLCVYDAKAINSEMNTTNNVWAMMYAGIERSNLCIRGLRTYGNPTPGSQLGALLGSALTLRAIYYADLLKTWGDVPARFEPISNETIYLPKSSRDIIYKQLIADLGEAATLVPWTTGSVEQINRAFVKGFRARLAMAASGYQQYPDGVRRSTDPELSVATMYALALKEAREVITSGKARLEPSFETFWKNYNKEVLIDGGESLWEIPFAEGRGRMLYTFAVRHDAIDQFQANGTGRGGVAGPLPTVFYDYDKADTRRNVTCVPYKYGPAVAGTPYPIAKQELTKDKLDTWYFGKYRYEWMTRRVISTNDDGVNKIYMRYAEVLLIAAEAANELESPAAAAPYLKEIRNRAFLPADRAVKVEAYVNALTSKVAMFNAIVDENKFEFTGEMERKQALIRWNLLKTKLDEAKVKMTNLQNRTGEYADVPTTLYYKYQADNVTLDIFGLNRGETTPPTGYTLNVSWTWTGTAAVTKSNSLYKVGVNPDQRQFWPIWKNFIDSSNQLLTNDYGY
ncbi:RagB/SusD family nutrient uptake outer membrane protein [Flavobacterium limnophilum]|uniref:RagB/SusD family nutrient uptake outer membrane protein n=1 Tax=Flavobacterium limnophilum TaxID=3003262 RepID=UPI002482A109|nr:RagB/SusD family nutrient uptake outer membrane protein [Flavobacterium limnophilum]